MPELERSIIKSCINNKDRKSQELVYKFLYPKIKKTCALYSSSEDQVNEYTQEVFSKIFLNLSKYSFLGSFEGWAGTIAKNFIFDKFRKKKNNFIEINEQIEERLYEETEDDYFTLKGVTPESVIKGVQKLSTAYRTVLNMYVFEDMSHAEIAEELGIKKVTSKTNYFKAKKNLLRIIKNEKQRN